MAKRRFRVRFKKKINIPRVVAKVAGVIIGLYVGGTIVSELGSVMNATQSSFYPGLKLIGWTVNSSNYVTAYDGSGILAVVGIVGIASIIMEFINFSL